MILRSKYYLFILIAVLLVFPFGFFITFAQPYPESPNAPDAVANLFFSKQIKSGESLTPEIPAYVPNALVRYVHPRSINFEPPRSIEAASYYGLPLIYGYLLIFLPLNLVFLLVAIVAAFSVFLLIRKEEKDDISSTLALAVVIFSPIFLYQATRGLLHNFLFFSLAFLSFYSLLVFKKQRYRSWIIISGAFLGLAGWVRLNELIWLLPLLFTTLIFIQKRNFIKKALLFLASFVFSLLPIFLLTYAVGGKVTQYVDVVGKAESSSAYIFIKGIIFPFGFSIVDSFFTFFLFAKEIWWLSIPGIAVFIYLIIDAIKKKNRFKVRAILFYFAVGIYLILYYGPFPIEQPKDTILIGHSHFRYWMPLFMSFVFLTAYGIFKIINKKYVSVIISLVVISISIWYSLYSHGGLIQLKQQNILAKYRNDQLHSYIQEEAILLAGKADKYTFPSWPTVGTSIHTNRDIFSKILIAQKIDVPVYYYHIDADISSHWTKEALENAGVTFEYVAQFHDGGNAWEYLYKLDWPNKE